MGLYDSHDVFLFICTVEALQLLRIKIRLHYWRRTCMNSIASKVRVLCQWAVCVLMYVDAVRAVRALREWK